MKKMFFPAALILCAALLFPSSSEALSLSDLKSAHSRELCLQAVGMRELGWDHQLIMAYKALADAAWGGQDVSREDAKLLAFFYAVDYVTQLSQYPDEKSLHEEDAAHVLARSLAAVGATRADAKAWATEAKKMVRAAEKKIMEDMP